MRRAAVCALAVSLLPARADGQSTDLERVLSLTRAYLQDYEQQLGAVVAEETYQQRIDTAANTPAATTGRQRQTVGPTGPTARTLVSDFLMMRWPGEAAWFGFRDVRLVDGRAVSDREERLLTLFARDPRDALARADLIAAESARYNIGNVARNINVPTQVLDFLHDRYRSRFTFERSGEETIDGVSTLKVAFEEREPPYLISTPLGAGVRARGQAWLDPQTGAVVQTQLDLTVAESRRLLRSRMTVTYRLDKMLGLKVPVELRESHEQSDPANRIGGGTTVNGRATYSNFRRFSIETKEQLVR